MSSIEANSSTNTPSTTRRLFVWLLVGMAGIAAAVWGRQLLYRQTASSRFDPTPLPRVKHDAPYIKTPDEIAEAVAIQAETPKDGVVYDLGCGDGRLAIAVATRYGCHGVGIDNDLERIAEAKENAKKHHVEDLVQFEEQDVFKVDLSHADTVVMYLLPWMVNQLIPQLNTMKAGSRIISHDFRFDEMAIDKQVEVNTANGDRHVLYCYTAPLRRSIPRKGQPVFHTP
jgi:SAM-dependent methyltransferase